MRLLGARFRRRSRRSGLTPFVLQHGSYSWLQAAVAGVLGFASGRHHLSVRRGGAHRLSWRFLRA